MSTDTHVLPIFLPFLDSSINRTTPETGRLFQSMRGAPILSSGLNESFRPLDVFGREAGNEEGEMHGSPQAYLGGRGNAGCAPSAWMRNPGILICAA